MTPRAVHRERANQAVIRTGRTPRRNVTWSEFCDLVRAAAGVQEMREELSRGWSNGSIISAAKNNGGHPTVLCHRCKTKIALANALDAEPDLDRWRREIVAGGKRRTLSRIQWALFEALYAARGSPMSTAFLVKAIAASGMRKHIRRLRQALLGSQTDAKVIGPPAEHTVQLVYELCGVLPGTRPDGQRVDGFDHALDALLGRSQSQGGLVPLSESTFVRTRLGSLKAAARSTAG